MPIEREEIVRILMKKLREEELTSAESQFLSEWAGRSKEHAQKIAEWLDEAKMAGKVKSIYKQDEESVWKIIESRIGVEEEVQQGNKSKIRILYKYFAVAVLVLLAGFAVFYIVIRPPKDKQHGKNVQAVSTDKGPGTDKAILILADGREIVLDSAVKGIVAHQTGANVVKEEQGEIEYQTTGGAVEGVMIHNMLTTPKSAKFKLVLTDGTKVFLNAESSIKFPTAFSKDERVVEVKGEAYFEVAKDETKPFKVIVDKKAAVEVLGTEFNIQAYQDEDDMTTSLVGGKLGITSFSSPKRVEIVAGQQVKIRSNNAPNVINDPGIDRAIAWTKGEFSFKDASLQSIKKDIQRWYDVEVEVEGELPGGVSGKAPRNISLNTLIEALQALKVNCTWENGKLILKPQKST